MLNFIATCAGKDWSLTHTEIASIASIVFFGEFCGGMFWGPLADRMGRRWITIYGKCIHICEHVIKTSQIQHALQSASRDS